MEDKLLTQKLNIPIGLNTPEVEHQCIEIVINNENCGANITSVEGVNERGKTAIIKDVVAETKQVIIKEPPKFLIPGYTETTWYDVLVKGHAPEFRKTIIKENEYLIREILFNSGVTQSIDDDSLFLSENFLNFWPFLFSRLSMKEDLRNMITREKVSPEMISDRNALTSFGMNLTEYLNENQFNEEVYLNALKIYSYLGRNNYIPTSKNTFVITSEEGKVFMSERGAGQDIQDNDRLLQEIVYRKIIESRSQRMYQDLLRDFVGHVWHVEMSHLEPKNGWGVSIDSMILSQVLKQLNKKEVMPNFFELPFNSEIFRLLNFTTIFSETNEPLHMTGDFSIVFADSELFIRTHPMYLESERNKLLKHPYWHIAAQPECNFKSPIETRIWFESILSSMAGIKVPNDTVYLGNAKKAEMLGIGSAPTPVDSIEPHASTDWLDGYWRSAVKAFSKGMIGESALFQVMLAAIEHACGKQGSNNLPAVSNDIYPGLSVRKKSGISYGEIMANGLLDPRYFAIDQENSEVFSLDTKLIGQWKNFLQYMILYTHGIDRLYIGNSIYFNGSGNRFSMSNWMNSGSTASGVNVLSTNLSLEILLDNHASDAILNKMIELSDKGEWQLPYGYDLGELVKLPGVNPKSILIHTLDLRDKRSPKSSFTKLSLQNELIRKHLIESGFFADFGHGPLKSLVQVEI